jgi:hypothetical protein
VTEVTSCNPHKEEDEGYLAAEARVLLSKNPYPRGTIRYDEWRRGWQIKKSEGHHEQDEGYQAAVGGLTLAQNPHPRGTIRYSEWRRGWQTRSEEAQRARRLGRD